jgi:hypothetical protein
VTDTLIGALGLTGAEPGPGCTVIRAWVAPQPWPPELRAHPESVVAIAAVNATNPTNIRRRPRI